MNQTQSQAAPQGTAQQQTSDFDQESSADRKAMLAACLRSVPSQDTEPHWGEGLASIMRRLQ